MAIINGQTNISNLILGNSQIKNVYLGTSGIWTNKFELNTETSLLLEIEGNATQYYNRFTELSAYRYLSTGSTISYFFDSNLDDNSSISNDLLFNNINTIYTYKYSLSNILYKSNTNIFKVDNLRFYYDYTNISGVTSGRNIDLSNYISGNTTQIITNGELNYYITGATSSTSIEIILNDQGTNKIDEITFYTEAPELGYFTINNNYSVYLKLVTSAKITDAGRLTDLFSYSKFKPYDGVATLWGDDEYGSIWNADTVSLTYDDFINIFDFDNITNTVTLTQYYDLGYYESAYNLYAEYSIAYNAPYKINLSVDGQFLSNQLILCYSNNSFEYNGYSQAFTSFSEYNTEKDKIKITGIKIITKCDITDIFD